MERQREETSIGAGFTAVNDKTSTAYLYTPPEHTADSFASQSGDAGVQQWVANKLAPIQQGTTPPASPEFRDLPSLSQATGFTSQDLPLYPDEHSQSAAAQLPLFHGESALRRSPPPARLTVTPPVQPKQPSDIFPTILGVTSPQEAVLYWNSRMGELKDFKAAMTKLPTVRRAYSHPMDEQMIEKISRPRSSGITKPKAAPKQATKPKAPIAASPKPSPLPQRRRTPKARLSHDLSDGSFGTAQQPAKHKRAPPSKKVEQDNVHWTELPDYAPPLTTLDTAPKPLKANWHSSPVDLSEDPDREHLHAQELDLAATLRLTCAHYLRVKRKILQARLQALKDGKNFTKTAAQGACKIDVNKASQLWQAFDKVGWFKESLYTQWL